MSKETLAQLSINQNNLKKASTVSDYEGIIRMFKVLCSERMQPAGNGATTLTVMFGFPQTWMAKGGYITGAEPYTKDLAHMSERDVANLFANYYLWYVKDGKPGHPTQQVGG